MNEHRSLSQSLGLQASCGIDFKMQDPGFCGIGKHNRKKAIILRACTCESNLSCACVFDGAELMPGMVLGIGISLRTKLRAE